MARHLHFTHAAQELVLPQPAVSLQIRRLEEELDFQLFDRTTRAVRLTDAGQMLLPSAQRILGELANAKTLLRETRDLKVGHVSVGSQQSLNASGVVPRVLIEYQNRHPGIEVALHETPTETTLAMLSDGRMDLALAHLEDQLDFSAIEQHPLFDEPVGIIAAVEHPLSARSDAIDISELAEERFIAFHETAGLRHILTRVCLEAGFEPRIACQSSALSSVRALVSVGLGIALMPLSSIREPGPPVQVVPSRLDLRRTITLIRQRDRYLSVAARTLWELLTERLAAWPPSSRAATPPPAAAAAASRAAP